MDKKVEVFRNKLFKLSEEFTQFCFMSRAKEFQLQSCQQLEELKAEASSLKKEMVKVHDEDSANALLSFEEMILALTSELKMWVALKEDDPNSAWDLLTDAQTAARTAMQAHSVANHLEKYLQRLNQLENLLFPPQTFFSPGMTIRYSECSICGSEYGECNHVVGRAYMGEMCVRIIKDFELREVSLVEEPANKRARMLSISDGGVKRDFLTWRVIPPESAEQKTQTTVDSARHQE